MTDVLTTSPLLRRAGAVAATGADAGVAWHYGDPTAEQRALTNGRAVVDQSHLGIVTVTGPDRLTWLHSLSTQQITGLDVGESTELMILSPKGRIEHVAFVVDDGATTWLISETAPGLAEHLDRMRFMLRVEVANVTDQWAALGAPRTEVEPGVVTWVDPWPRIGPGGTTYVEADARVADAWTWQLALVPRTDLDEEVQRRIDAGDRLVGTWALEALRIAAHRPRGMEVDEVALPHEFDWLRTAVHLHKGCYRGQETVAKVHNVGRPPRRLTLLHLDGSDADLPVAQASVLLGDKQIGHVTSAARHHELGPIALALLKRSVDPAAALVVEGESGPITAAQEVIVNTDGHSADRPPQPGPTMRGLLMGKGCAADGGDMS